MARRNRNSSRKESAPGWVWMLFGLSLGLVVAIGVYLEVPLRMRAAEPTPTATAPPAAQRSAARASQRVAAASAPRETPPENRFDFYEILPQAEVVVSEDATPVRGAKPRPAQTPGSFLLQAGSFSAAADADRLKANLALLGIESHVQRVTLDGDDVFNRVRIGPIDDIDAAKRTQRQLREAGIDTLLMQVPK